MSEPGGRGGPSGGRMRTETGPPRLENSAGGVVYRRCGNRIFFLLIRDPYENWGLPKGHLEPGETPQDAAKREIEEETGLDNLHLGGILPTIDWYFRDQEQLVHKYCRFFLFESPAGDPRPQLEEGISDCIWLTPDDAIRTLSYDNARKVVRAAKARLQPPPDPTD